MFFQLSKKKGSQVIKKPEKVKGSLFIWALPLCLILNWVLSVCEDIQDGDNNWNWKWLTALRCHQKDCASLPQKRFLRLQIRHLDDDEIFCLNCRWNISGGLNGTGHFYKFMQMNFFNIEIMFGSRDTHSYMSLSNAVTQCNSWNGCCAMHSHPSLGEVSPHQPITASYNVLPVWDPTGGRAMHLCLQTSLGDWHV